MTTTRLAALAATLAAAAALSNAHAQDRPPARATQEAQLTLGNMIKNGGWTMWPLGFCSVAFVGLTIFNLFYIREKRLAPPPAADQLEKDFGRLDFEAARNLCAATRSPLTRIVAAGLERSRDGRIIAEEIQGGMEGAAPEQVAKTQTTINYLSVVGVIAPMLGLLGTVSGMIQAFQSMSLQGMGRPSR